MTIPSLKRKLILLGAAVLLTLAVCVVSYEAVQYFDYRAWKASFDNDGWLNRITVASPNETLIWEYKPYGRYQDDRQRIETNRYGFRDVDYATPAKPTGVHRVAVVGDSVPLGFLVSPRQGLVKQLETLGNERSTGRRELQALNFGVDGYNALQVLETVGARALEFSPDQVIYVMGLNDFDFDDASGQKILYFRKPASFLLWKLRRLRHRWSGLEYYDYYYGRTRGEVFDAIVATRDLLEGRGVGFSVALLPVFGRDAGHFTDYPHEHLHDEVTGFLERNGIPHLDLLEVFRETGRPATHLSYDVWHPNPEGHRLIGAALLELVEP